MATVDREIIPAGKTIGNYEIVFLVGRGGFGDVYKVKDKKTSQMFALKTEEMNAPIKAMQTEIDILNILDGNCFPKLRTNGTDKKYRISYFVMNILGSSIGQIRRKNDDKLSYDVAFPLAHEMLRIIEKIHSFGYVHRDIKPSNFLLQQNPTDHLVLIDFGLCKKHIDESTNQPIPFSENVIFTGTKKYASPNAHRHFELGRVDDLYSWFYGFLEIANGDLPWNSIKETETLLRMKTETPVSEIINGLPAQVGEIYEYLNSLQYDDVPDYTRIHGLLNDAEKSITIGSSSFNWNDFYSANARLADLTKSISVSSVKTVSDPHSKKKDNDDEVSCCIIQ